MQGFPGTRMGLCGVVGNGARDLLSRGPCPSPVFLCPHTHTVLHLALWVRMGEENGGYSRIWAGYSSALSHTQRAEL